MTNLDRLKGTGLLIQGFDEFLGHWLEIEPNLEPLEWDDETMALFDSLPRDVRDYYALIQRWPDALQIDRITCRFSFPPRKRSDGESISIAASSVGEHLDYIALPGAAENNQLHVKRRNAPWSEPMAIACDPDEWLVGMGFLALASQASAQQPYRRLIDEFQLIFSGMIYSGDLCLVRYHPDGFLWFSSSQYQRFLLRKQLRFSLKKGKWSRE